MSQKTALVANITTNKIQSSHYALQKSTLFISHYIRAMVEFHTPERTGQRSDNIFQLLKVPNLKRKTFAACSYSVAAPLWWNELPNSIKLAGNIDIFKTK